MLALHDEHCKFIRSSSLHFYSAVLVMFVAGQKGKNRNKGCKHPEMASPRCCHGALIDQLDLKTRSIKCSRQQSILSQMVAIHKTSCLVFVGWDVCSAGLKRVFELSTVDRQIPVHAITYPEHYIMHIKDMVEDHNSEYWSWTQHCQ